MGPFSFSAVAAAFVPLVSSAVAGGFECIREMVIAAASAVEPSAQRRIDFVFLFITVLRVLSFPAQQGSTGFPFASRKRRQQS